MVEAEKLLRVALFSDALKLSELPRISETLASKGEARIRSQIAERRGKLAQSLREYRRKGVVPVFFSFMWFFFALAISIVSASSVVFVTLDDDVFGIAM